MTSEPEPQMYSVTLELPLHLRDWQLPPDWSWGAEGLTTENRHYQEVIDALGHYAVKLANATDDLHWVDAAIEVHLVAARPLRLETLRQLETLRARGPLGNDALMARYYETIRARLWSMTPDERILVSRIAEFVFDLDRSG